LSDVDPLQGARRVLLDHLPKDLILARYQVAGGQELTSGKFANPESSAALVANAFGLFADRPDLLILPGERVACGAATRVELEAQMRFPWSGGYHPWLDVAVESATDLIGIESKRYEPFRDRKSAVFSPAYTRAVWGEAMAPFEAMRDELTGGRTFRFLDAAQLVKHAFGLRTEAQRLGRRPTLFYLYAEPQAYPDGRLVSQEDVAAHRLELGDFTAAVATTVAEVHFCSCSYADLLATWSAQPDLRDHAGAIAGRFDVGAQ
jgi:hypothetical protein